MAHFDEARHTGTGGGAWCAGCDAADQAARDRQDSGTRVAERSHVGRRDDRDRRRRRQVPRHSVNVDAAATSVCVPLKWLRLGHDRPC